MQKLAVINTDEKAPMGPTSPHSWVGPVCPRKAEQPCFEPFAKGQEIGVFLALEGKMFYSAGAGAEKAHFLDPTS